MKDRPVILYTILALTITLTTVLILYSLKSLTVNQIVISGLLVFVSSFIISYLTLYTMVFRKILNIRSYLNKLGNSYQTGLSLDHIMKTIKGINEKKDSEIKELKSLVDFRKDFIADVSHELKTPLFAAQGFVHTLLDGAVKDKKVRDKFLKKAARSLDGLDVLVQDLMTLSQMEIGGIRMHFEYFDIAQLTREVFDQLESRAGKKEILFKLDNPPQNQVLVYADPQKIYQVLLNLISNAINYTDEKGSVLVSFEPQKTKVIVKVIDNGIGIPDEDLDRIFQRFYRVDKSRSRKQGGSGLGLAIVKHIVELHDSKIMVKSKVGQGTEFSFSLRKGKPEPLFQTKNEA